MPLRLNVIRDTLVVALAGNPNCGKTTLFNALTGLRQKVANYPGVTVERKVGKCTLPDNQTIDVVDLPGTYSLISRSPDELIAMQVLRGLRHDMPAPDVVVCVVDASNLQRNLYLVSQLIELGKPMLIALNMMDIADRRGLRVSAEKLSQQIGVPVIPIVGSKRQGIDELKRAIKRAIIAPLPRWQLPEVMHDELMLVGGGLAILDDETRDELSSGFGTPIFETIGKKTSENNPMDRYLALAERLLIGDLAPDVEAFAKREPMRKLLDDANARLKQMGIDPMQADIEAHYHWIDQISLVAVDHVPENANNTDNAGQTTLDYQRRKQSTSESLDRVLLHHLWGLLVFAAVMACVFVSIFSLAAPLMDGLSKCVDTVGGWIGQLLPAEGVLADLWKDGIVAGVGGVLVFVPQIAILFGLLAILEDSGYLARAAFLMDRLLAKVGLSGKAFVPLLSGFACAIPGIMATRTIEDKRSRLATIFVLPFMSCSARLPVYTLLIGSFFAAFSPAARGGIMLACYTLGVIAAVVVAWSLSWKRRHTPTSFVLELPTYKWPQLQSVLRAMWTNTKAFLTKAGTTIFALSVILWAATYWPRVPPEQSNMTRRTAVLDVAEQSLKDIVAQPFNPSTKTSSQIDEIRKLSLLDANQFTDLNADKFKELNIKITTEELDSMQIKAEHEVASEQLRYSFAGRFGHLIEPAIRPLGYDWKMGVGLVGAFAAREMFVGTMSIVYAAGEDNDQGLSSAMLADRYPDGKTGLETVGSREPVDLVCTGNAVPEYSRHRQTRNGWLEVGHRPVGLHERLGICPVSDRLSNRNSTGVLINAEY